MSKFEEITNCPNLVMFIKEENKMRSFFDKNPELISPIDIKEKDIKFIIDSVDTKLSPENLHCDGEISYEQAMSKRDYLNAVLQELSKVTGCKI